MNSLLKDSSSWTQAVFPPALKHATLCPCTNVCHANVSEHPHFSKPTYQLIKALFSNQIWNAIIPHFKMTPRQCKEIIVRVNKCVSYMYVYRRTHIWYLWYRLGNEKCWDVGFNPIPFSYRLFQTCNCYLLPSLEYRWIRLLWRYSKEQQNTISSLLRKEKHLGAACYKWVSVFQYLSPLTVWFKENKIEPSSFKCDFQRCLLFMSSSSAREFFQRGMNLTSVSHVALRFWSTAS